MFNYDSDDSDCLKCSCYSFCWPTGEKPKCNESNFPVKQRHLIKKKEVLNIANHVFRSLWVIRRGGLKTYQTADDGSEIIRGFYFPGEIMGFDAIYPGHYLYSAFSLTETILCEISYENFLNFQKSNLNIQKHSLYLVSKELSMGSYLFLIKAEQRLAAFLIDLASRLHPSKIQSDFTIPMNRQDIGNYLKLTAETISRLLSHFKKNKIIAINHKQIQFLQLEKLKRIAGF